MQLRNYQIDAIKKIYAAWESGAQNVLLQLSTGGGKTIIFSHIISSLKVPTVAIAHRIELVSQISLTLARNNIKHSFIAQKPAIRNIIALHFAELKKSFYDPQSSCVIACVDTLLRIKNPPPWFKHIKLIIQDEGHHPLRENKWGKAANLFPNARGLYPTATPCRADGKGLGRHADGIIDALVVGPNMRDLIREGFLSEYRVFCPPSDLDLSTVNISASGDYSPEGLRTATHKSHIHGDIISHYLKIAPNKLGLTFAVDVKAATEIAEQFRLKGIPSEVVTSKTPDILRVQIMKRFRAREILQLVSVDLLSEGIDVPAVEVISMARATQSYAVFAQQFGRALRPLQGKEKAIIIDHVGNTLRHGLPDDLGRTWTLDRRENRKKSNQEQISYIKTCLNPACLSVYERIYKACPYCRYCTPPAQRSDPAFVDGDLIELMPEVLLKLRNEINRVDGAPRIPQTLEVPAQLAIAKRHQERAAQQMTLRAAIAQWAGIIKNTGADDSTIYRQFYRDFGIDIATAQTLGAKEAFVLMEKINSENLRKTV